jgi:hypothetical protein
MSVFAIHSTHSIYSGATDISVTPRVTRSAVDDGVFANYQPVAAEAPATQGAHPQPFTLEFRIKRAGIDLFRTLKKSSRISKQLDDIVKKIKDMKVEQIEVIAYAPFFRELSTPRAQAVKDYLIAKGIDANLISAHGEGVDYGAADSALAKNLGFTVKITGTHEPDSTTEVVGNHVSRPAHPRTAPDVSFA